MRPHTDYVGKCNDLLVGDAVTEKCPVMCDSCIESTATTITTTTTTNNLIGIDTAASASSTTIVGVSIGAAAALVAILV